MANLKAHAVVTVSGRRGFSYYSVGIYELRGVRWVCVGRVGRPRSTERAVLREAPEGTLPRSANLRHGTPWYGVRL